MQTRKKIFLLCLLILLALVGACQDTSDVDYPSANDATLAPLSPQRQIISSTLGLKEQWHIQIPAEAKAYQSIPGLMFAAGDKVILPLEGPIVDRKALYGLLTAYALDDGHLVWQTWFDTEYTGQVSDAIIIRETNTLYLLHSLRMSRFDLENGQEIWETKTFGAHTSVFFASDQLDPLWVRSTDQELFSVDPVTGKILSRMKDQDPRISYYLADLRISYHDGVLEGAERSIGRKLWTLDDKRLPGQPLLLGEDILWTNAAPAIYLDRFNAYTGQPVWSADPFASNYAIVGQTLYTLYTAGHLVALDVNSGIELGRMSFDRYFNMASEQPFWVAASPPYVILYFGDSHELWVFKE